jgi:hypothetical protein
MESGTSGVTNKFASIPTTDTRPNTVAIIGKVKSPADRLSAISNQKIDFSFFFGTNSGAKIITPKKAAKDKYHPTLRHS